jgi:hypothetical protein
MTLSRALLAPLAAAAALLSIQAESWVGAQQAPGSATSPRWGPVVEADAPFFSAVLDARGLGEGWPADNLTPRGLVLNLGHGYWACFDVDLLRVAAIWSGAGVTPVGMAQGSYETAGTKAPEGQRTLPTIAGSAWLANGLYPGWQAGRSVDISLSDPRSSGSDPREPGRGPVDPAAGRFRAVRLTAEGAVLEYDVRGATIEEQIVARTGASSSGASASTGPRLRSRSSSARPVAADRRSRPR